jgi:hypothetical protein
MADMTVSPSFSVKTPAWALRMMEKSEAGMTDLVRSPDQFVWTRKDKNLDDALRRMGSTVVDVLWVAHTESHGCALFDKCKHTAPRPQNRIFSEGIRFGLENGFALRAVSRFFRPAQTWRQASR